LAFFALLATTAIAGFLVYRIVKPQRANTEINMASFPGRPEVLDFEVPGGIGKREGWFFPGLRGAPTIILCHGYESSRGELLTLESALQTTSTTFSFLILPRTERTGESARWVIAKWRKCARLWIFWQRGRTWIRRASGYGVTTLGRTRAA